MTTLSGLTTITNGTSADASQVDGNFDTIVNYINNNVIVKDGLVAMTGALTLPGNPTSDLEAAPKQYVDNAIPIGAMMPYGGATAPSGWLLCDGTQYDGTIAPYDELGTVLGTSYNTGGETAGYFRVPDTRSVFLAGKGTATWSNSLTDKGGSKDAVVVQHTHTASSGIESTSHTHSVSSLSVDVDHDHGSTATDGNHSHTIDLGPYTDPYRFLVPASRPNVSNKTTVSAPDVAGSQWAVGNIQDFSTTGTANHSHAIANYNDSNRSVSGSLGGVSVNHSHTITVTSTGESGSGKNLPPYITVNYIIRY